MRFNEINPPYVELPKHTLWHRIQRAKPLRGSARIKGLILPPAGTLTGRFDLAKEVTAYLADSELSALYESLFRREARTCSLEAMRARSLVSFRATGTLRLVDLRRLEESFPVLQSLRYEATQAIATASRKRGAQGVLFSSAQHPTHECVCLFEAGIAQLKKVDSVPLVEPGTDRLHRTVITAAWRSQVPIVP